MASIETRVAHLEANFASEKALLEGEISELRDEIKSLKARLSYYDKMALKWGGFAIGILSVAAAIGLGADKLKDKLVDVFFR